MKIVALRKSSSLTLEPIEPSTSYFFNPTFTITINKIKSDRTRVTFQIYFKKNSFLFQVIQLCIGKTAVLSSCFRQTNFEDQFQLFGNFNLIFHECFALAEILLLSTSINCFHEKYRRYIHMTDQRRVCTTQLWKSDELKNFFVKSIIY